MRRSEQGQRQGQDQKALLREPAPQTAKSEPGVGRQVAAQEPPLNQPGQTAAAAPAAQPVVPPAPAPSTATADRPAPTEPGAPGAPATPPSPMPNAEQGVREALRRYEAAYESLDAQGVKRILPSVNVQELAKAFAAYKAYDMTVEVGQIDVQGLTARATCVVKRSFTPKVGRGASLTAKSVFRLEKVGGDWIVAGIDAR